MQKARKMLMKLAPCCKNQEFAIFVEVVDLFISDETVLFVEFKSFYN